MEKREVYELICWFFKDKNFVPHIPFDIDWGVFFLLEKSFFYFQLEWPKGFVLTVTILENFVYRIFT